MPQESILWPLLFLLHVYDLPGVIVDHSIMFTNDTKALTSSKDGRALIIIQYDGNTLTGSSEI